MQFLLGIIQSSDYEDSVKQAAGQAFMSVIEQRPKLLAKKNLVVPCLASLMGMIAKEDGSAAGALFSVTPQHGILDEDDEDGDYAPDVDVQRLAQTIIDTMAIYIPSKYFVEPALNLCAQVS